MALLTLKESQWRVGALGSECIESWFPFHYWNKMDFNKLFLACLMRLSWVTDPHSLFLTLKWSAWIKTNPGLTVLLISLRYLLDHSIIWVLSLAELSFLCASAFHSSALLWIWVRVHVGKVMQHSEQAKYRLWYENFYNPLCDNVTVVQKA